MAINSAGYDGSIYEPEWSDLLASGGGRMYGVADAGSWKVTAGTAEREVRIAPGRGFGYGVRDVSDSIVSISLPAAPLSGSRYDLIAAHRDWQTNKTTFARVEGSAAPAIPGRAATPGLVDDQPVALVKVTAGQSQVTEIRDLRVWGGDGGALAVDDLVLQYLNRLGTKVRIKGTTWARTIDSLGSPTWVREVTAQHEGRAGLGIVNIDVPADRMLELPSGLSIKTGHMTSGTTVEFGHEYFPTVQFAEAFPKKLLSVSITPVYQGIANGPPRAIGVDVANLGGFRALVYGSPDPWYRSFLWVAFGY